MTITGNVLTAAFMLSQPKTKTVVECFSLSVMGMSKEEWETLKYYIEHGTFMQS